MVGPFDDVLVPRRSGKTDWEVELAVVVGSTSRYLDRPTTRPGTSQASCCHTTCRSASSSSSAAGSGTRARAARPSTRCGPFLATADELGDIQSLGMRLWVNDTLRQDGSTSSMIFGVNHLVWYLSQFMVLRPGDIINTGTPAGVALGQPDPKPYLRAGDVVRLEIDGLGSARQEVKQA